MALPRDAEERLNNGAAHARREFEEKWEQWNVRDLARWWSKWCRREVVSDGRILNGTNHDRLGRILLEVSGVKPQPQGIVLDFDPFCD